MKYTKKFMILVLLIAGLILGISYMFTRSNEQQESITGTTTLAHQIRINQFMVSHDILPQHQTHHRKFPKYSIGQSSPSRKITDTN